MNLENLQSTLRGILELDEDTFETIQSVMVGDPSDETHPAYSQAYEDLDINDSSDYSSLPNYSVTLSYLDAFRPLIPSMTDSGELTDGVDEIVSQHNESQGVCGYNHYVKPAHIRMDSPGDPCGECMSLDELEQYYSLGETEDGTPISAELSSRYSSDGGDWPDNLPSLSNYASQCHYDPFVWVPAQQERNPYLMEPQMQNWTQIRTILDPDYSGDDVLSGNHRDLVEKWYLERMTRAELLSNMNQLNYRPDIEDDDERLRLFKLDISRDRGATISCTESINGVADITPDFTVSNVPVGFQCDPSGHFGPENVIIDEYQEWSMNYLQNPPQQMSETQLATLGTELLPVNPGFEQCMNTLLEEVRGVNELEIIEQIHQASSLLELESRHIQYIKRKLELVLTESHRGSIQDCIQTHIYVDTTICQTGLTEQMYLLLNILFSVIGFNFHIDHMDPNDETHKQKLIEIIDTLGDLIPRVLEKIIEMSEYLEIDVCGSTSNKTAVLRELYTQLFRPPSQTVNFDLGLSELISSDTTSDKEFTRTTVLGGLGLALLKFI